MLHLLRRVLGTCRVFGVSRDRRARHCPRLGVATYVTLIEGVRRVPALNRVGSVLPGDGGGTGDEPAIFSAVRPGADLVRLRCVPDWAGCSSVDGRAVLRHGLVLVPSSVEAGGALRVRAAGVLAAVDGGDDLFDGGDVVVGFGGELAEVDVADGVPAVGAGRWPELPHESSAISASPMRS